MTRENFERVWTAFARRHPWQPFTLELSNGVRIEVNHPEAVQRHGDVLACHSTSGLRSYFENTDVVRFINATGIS